MKTVDACGMLCPRPIIETKKGLKELLPGEFLKVLIDNETSLSNVSKFLKDNGCQFTQVKEDDYWALSISSPGSPLSEKPAEDYCEVLSPNMAKGNYVVALTSDIMGQGDETLGRKLMTSFVNVLTELDHLPSSVVCYNSGVKLALTESSVVDTLKELEIRGVEVLLCGTCIDFFGIKGKTEAGVIADMYLIACKLSAAGNVIKP